MHKDDDMDMESLLKIMRELSKKSGEGSMSVPDEADAVPVDGGGSEPEGSEEGSEICPECGELMSEDSPDCEMEHGVKGSSLPFKKPKSVTVISMKAVGKKKPSKSPEDEDDGY